MTIVITALVGLFSGLAAGLLGIGGGIIAVPTLTFLGVSGASAVGTSSLAIFLTSLVGTYENWRKAKVDLKRALPIALAAALTSQLGVWGASNIEESFLLVGFGVFAITNIYLLSLKRNMAKTSDGDAAAAETKTPSNLRYSLVGGVTGFCSGLFGVGGGVILVPLLVNSCHVKIKEAAAMSLYVIFLTSIATVIGHTLHENVIFSMGAIFGLSGIIGVRIAIRKLGGLSDAVITRLFILLMILVGSYMIWKGLKPYFA